MLFAPAKPLASAADLASQLLRALVMACGRREGSGGVTLTLSETGGPRDTLVLEEEEQADTGGGGGGGRKRGRRGGKNKQPQQQQAKGLSKAKLTAAIAADSAAGLRSRVAERGRALGPCPPSEESSWRITAAGPQLWAGGRYVKHARNVPQTRWVAKGERIGQSSVEEEVAAVVLPLTGGTATLGAAGIAAPRRRSGASDGNAPPHSPGG
jgi:hypothetical protein